MVWAELGLRLSVVGSRPIVRGAQVAGPIGDRRGAGRIGMDGRHDAADPIDDPTDFGRSSTDQRTQATVDGDAAHDQHKLAGLAGSIDHCDHTVVDIGCESAVQLEFAPRRRLFEFAV